MFLSYNFISDCAGSALLCGLFSSCHEHGQLSSCSPWPYCSCLSGGGAQVLGHTGFRSCGTWVVVPRL